MPPFPEDQAIALIERQLGAPVSELFARFDSQPLASASVAQVHAAQLKSGEEVVVKVVRPGLKPVIRQDLAWLFLLARIAERASADARRLHPVDVVSDYEKTIYDELDLLREAANASQLRRNFEGSPLLYVPQVYWDPVSYTHLDVYKRQPMYMNVDRQPQLQRHREVPHATTGEPAWRTR